MNLFKKFKELIEKNKKYVNYIENNEEYNNESNQQNIIVSITLFLNYRENYKENKRILETKKQGSINLDTGIVVFKDPHIINIPRYSQIIPLSGKFISRGKHPLNIKLKEDIKFALSSSTYSLGSDKEVSISISSGVHISKLFSQGFQEIQYFESNLIKDVIINKPLVNKGKKKL